MLTEADYQQILKAQERALKLACHPEFKAQAMRAYGLAGQAMRRWDEQQIKTIQRKGK